MTAQRIFAPASVSMDVVIIARLIVLGNARLSVISTTRCLRSANGVEYRSRIDGIAHRNGAVIFSSQRQADQQIRQQTALGNEARRKTFSRFSSIYPNHPINSPSSIAHPMSTATSTTSIRLQRRLYNTSASMTWRLFRTSYHYDLFRLRPSISHTTQSFQTQRHSTHHNYSNVQHQTVETTCAQPECRR